MLQNVSQSLESPHVSLSDQSPQSPHSIDVRPSDHSPESPQQDSGGEPSTIQAPESK